MLCREPLLRSYRAPQLQLVLRQTRNKWKAIIKSQTYTCCNAASLRD
uniref:Uncharacterized protein n=1 Tax=Anopheles arabiensis TaxID=7173 RepID=A0A182IGZ0_ANOAR